MKKMKIILILCLACSVAIFAETTTYSSITAGLMLNAPSKPIPGDNHFAPSTGFGFDGAYVQGMYGATFPISLGDHPIFTGSYIGTQVDLTLTPVHISPSFNVTFSPLPFLNFTAGATIGAGWIFGDELLVGIHTYDKAKKEYTPNSAFSTMYYDVSMSATFMFDMAIFFPGDWNHVVTMASYKLGYTGLTSGGDGTPWNYIMGGKDKANGLNYSASVMLGYQMPIALQIVGFEASFNGYFFEDDYNTETYDWDPTFMSVSLNAIAMIKLAENHSLAIQSGFSSRRSFDKTHTYNDPFFDQKTVGREWFFNGIAILYTYSF